MENSKVIVPQADINRIDEIRQELHELFQQRGISAHEYSHLTSELWRIANRQYPLVDTDCSYSS